MNLDKLWTDFRFEDYAVRKDWIKIDWIMKMSLKEFFIFYRKLRKLSSNIFDIRDVKFIEFIISKTSIYDIFEQYKDNLDIDTYNVLNRFLHKPETLKNKNQLTVLWLYNLIESKNKDLLNIFGITKNIVYENLINRFFIFYKVIFFDF